MIACVSSPPDAAPVSNRHMNRSCVMRSHRVWVPWLPVFTQPQVKSSLYAAIQFSRYLKAPSLPFHYLADENSFFISSFCCF